ncbi:hypothetical protein [Nonomuraea sp. NPDC049784]
MRILFRLCSAGTRKVPEADDSYRQVIPQLRAKIEDPPKVSEPL